MPIRGGFGVLTCGGHGFRASVRPCGWRVGGSLAMGKACVTPGHAQEGRTGRRIFRDGQRRWEDQPHREDRSSPPGPLPSRYHHKPAHERDPPLFGRTRPDQPVGNCKTAIRPRTPLPDGNGVPSSSSNNAANSAPLIQADHGASRPCLITI